MLVNMGSGVVWNAVSSINDRSEKHRTITAHNETKIPQTFILGESIARIDQEYSHLYGRGNGPAEYL